jgi:TBC domain-containing protein kinase-like protein
VREIYYLWQLAGGDVFAELRKHGLMITTPPVVSIPSLLVGEGQVREFLHL